jgi:hypothetical protein
MCSAKRHVRFTPKADISERPYQTAICETCKRRYGSLDFARIAYITLTSKPKRGRQSLDDSELSDPGRLGWIAKSSRSHTFVQPVFKLAVTSPDRKGTEQQLWLA